MIYKLLRDYNKTCANIANCPYDKHNTQSNLKEKQYNII